MEAPQWPGTPGYVVSEPYDPDAVNVLWTSPSGVALPEFPLRVMWVACNDRNIISCGIQTFRQTSGVGGVAGRFREVVQAQERDARFTCVHSCKNSLDTGSERIASER